MSNNLPEGHALQSSLSPHLHAIHQPHLLFISLDWSRPKDLRRPLAMASIEAYFRANQTESICADFRNFNLDSPDFSLHSVLQVIHDARPKFLALGSYIWNEKYVPGIVAWTKDHFPETIVILGGPQVTYGDCDLAKEYPGVDYFIRGEGEMPFTELINTLCRSAIPDRKLLRNYAIYTPEILNQGVCDRIFTVDLNELESPYLSHTLSVEQRQTFVRWETLRRCPYRCSFCQYHLAGSKMQEFDHGRIFRELEFFRQKEVREINVLDPIFNLRADHYLNICRRIEACGIQSRFYLQCRLELLLNRGGEQFLAFCRNHAVWLEFGVQTFREIESAAIERENNYRKIDKAIELLHQFNVPFDLHLIFGLPFQSLDGFLSSYDRAKEAQPRGLYIFPLNLLKGTNLYKRRDEWEYDFDTEDNNVLLQSKWMKHHEIRRLKEVAEGINRRSKDLRNDGSLLRLPDLGSELN